MIPPHDPIADPLTPYWRAKVDQAAHPSALRARLPAVVRRGGLTPRQRRYVELVEIQGLSVRDAAVIEGVQCSWIYTALSQARKIREAGA